MDVFVAALPRTLRACYASKDGPGPGDGPRRRRSGFLRFFHCRQIPNSLGGPRNTWMRTAERSSPNSPRLAESDLAAGIQYRRLRDGTTASQLDFHDSIEVHGSQGS